MSLSVEYERPCDRLHYPVTAPLFVTFRDQRYRASEWSLEGLRIDNVKKPLPAIGEEIEAGFTLPFDGFDISYRAKITILRHTEDGAGIVARFVDLGEREERLMTYFITELLRGSMSSFKDMIQRIDVPVTPVSIEPDAKVQLTQKPQKGWRSWLRKSYVMPVLYGIMGLVVFGYTAMVAYANIFKMVVESAVVGGRVEVMRSQADGRLVYDGITEGQRVPEGQVIARIEDPDLDQKIQSAAIAIRKKEAELAYLETLYQSENRRMAEYARLQKGKTSTWKKRIAGLEKQVRYAKKRYLRLKHLHKKKLVTWKRLDEAKEKLLRLEKDLSQAREELLVLKNFQQRNKEKQFYNGRELIGNVSKLKAQIALLQRQINLVREEHRLLLKQRDQRVIKAPFHGLIVELPRFSNSGVQRGDVVAILEPAGRLQVTAYLTQEEILKVALGDRATVYIPALDRSVPAKIVTVNRRYGFVDAAQSRYTWRASDERNAQVILEITAKQEDIKDIKAGLPAVVIFSDRGKQPHMATMIQAQAAS